jgi:ketosteroid isomerase-like protein
VQPLSTNDRGRLVAALTEQADRWDKAIVRKDRAAIEANMADDFRQIDGAGNVETRQSFVDGVMAPELEIAPYTVEDFDARIYGDVALLSGRTRMTGKYQGKTFNTHYRYIDVYVRRDDEWKIVSVQISKIPATAASAPPASDAKDGQHDFDFEIGTWKTHLRRRLHPLTGSDTWVEYDGTSLVRKIWNGRANLVELDVTGPAGHLEALSLRLYNAQTRQWSLNFSAVGSGTMGEPAIGQFTQGRGEFVDREMFDGRLIDVRFVITQVSPDTCRFEQSFSSDGGKTWEVNWIAIDTRQ